MLTAASKIKGWLNWSQNLLNAPVDTTSFPALSLLKCLLQYHEPTALTPHVEVSFGVSPPTHTVFPDMYVCLCARRHSGTPSRNRFRALIIIMTKRCAPFFLLLLRYVPRLFSAQGVIL